ncbi:hypothetical protein HPB51_013169 [Rhipicephalus microplus]|uniref:Endonuclease/exonuclease/phosphatase domain-containing protein n=1 Tax=Rhipicephalus microplus TaxID=6941 RepID=A0A9J6E1I6_RHIMP|nr:hypothetical protein HPB51_013169 [Rhipicephalus microplus]
MVPEDGRTGAENSSGSDRTDCADHMWMKGDMMGILSAVCVVYMAVQGAHYAENEWLLECVLEDVERLAGCREVLILGDFNYHISELDGYTDVNGKLIIQLSENVQLEILNNSPRCEGQTTCWARRSATSIDYALASDGLVKSFSDIHIMWRAPQASGAITIDFGWISLKPITEGQIQNEG